MLERRCWTMNRARMMESHKRMRRGFRKNENKRLVLGVMVALYVCQKIFLKPHHESLRRLSGI